MRRTSWESELRYQRVDGERNENEAEDERRGGPAARPPQLSRGGRRGRQSRQPSARSQPFILRGPFAPELVFLHHAGEDDVVHGKLFGPQMAVEEVDREDEA